MTKTITAVLFFVLSTQAVFASNPNDLLISYDGTESKAELRAVRSVLAGSLASGQILSLTPRSSGGGYSAGDAICVSYVTEKSRQADIVTIKTVSGMSSRLSLSCGY